MISDATWLFLLDIYQISALACLLARIGVLAFYPNERFEFLPFVRWAGICLIPVVNTMIVAFMLYAFWCGMTKQLRNRR